MSVKGKGSSKVKNSRVGSRRIKEGQGGFSMIREERNARDCLGGLRGCKKG